MLRRSFRAMGTDCTLFLKTQPRPAALRAMTEAERDVRRLETIFSRFDPDSELSELNRRGTLPVGPELLEVVDLALAARERTSGRFDPTVHDALVAAGYDRTFDEVSAHDLGRGDPGASSNLRCGGSVRVDRETRSIQLDPGVHLDLGGIAKGYAVDRAADVLGDLGPCLVDAGGDIAARGGGWPIGLDIGDGTLTLELGDGAVATSGRDRRRWTRGTEELHHIIDPATGVPAAGDLLRVTAVAATATDAEVRAKALFLTGAEDAEREANTTATPAVLVTLDGRTLFAGGLA
jgi:thiamine biosynthesis lipoprotein